ncbi:MAG: PKD domain-containing protein [Planctomycetota bacterium]
MANTTAAAPILVSKKSIAKSLPALAILMWCCAVTGVQAAAPTVTTSSSNQAQNATTIIITGTNFSTTLASNTVAFNLGAVGSVTAATTVQITVTFSTLPTSTGSLTANVTVAGAGNGSSGAVQVANVVAAPTVTANTANLAQNAPTFTIAGTNFSTTAANNTVAFNLGAVGTVTAATATQLTVTFSTQPTSTGSLTANVTVAGGSTGAVQVATVVAAPTLTTNTANLAINAPTLILTGTNFSTTAANNTVSFTSLSAVGTVTAATATQLTVTFSTLPNATGALNARVTVAGGSTSTVQVATVVAAPTVTANTANLAQNAPTFTIAGTNFSTTAANNTVAFNLGAVGTVTAATATQLTVTFSTQPTSTGSLTANVTVAGGSTGAVQVATVVAAPTLTTNTANLAINAPTLILTGTNFSTTAANNTVSFTSLSAVGTVTAATATQLTVTFSTLPNATGALNARVTVAGGSTSTVQVATVVAAPTISAGAVTQAQSVTTVLINGTNFSATPAQNTVTFTSLGAVGSVTSATTTQLTVTFSTQPNAAGALNANVTVFGGTTSTVTVANIVATPTVTTSSASLAINSPTLIISGSNFSTTPAQNTVTFTSLSAVGTVTAATATQLTVTFSTQPNATGVLNATVTAFGATTTATQVAAVVAAPTITTSSANLARNAPTMIITGTNFSTTPANNAVSFTTLGAVGTVTAATATQLTVTFSTLPNSTGALNASVTVFGGSTATVQVATIVLAPTITASTTNQAQTVTTVVINGSNFSATPANNSVAFNLGAVGTITSASATQLSVTFTTQPTATGALNATVIVFGGSTGAVQVATITPNPTILSNVANLAQNAPTMTISGTNFSTTPNQNSVVFTTLGAAGTVTASTTTQLTVTFSTQPTATGALNANVTVFGGTTSTVQVATIVPAPTLIANTSNLAQNAPTILLTGTNFSTTPANNTVTFTALGAVGTVTAATATQLTVTFTTQPNATGILNANVRVFGGTTATVQVAAIVPAPTITTSSAPLAQNAPTMTISGTNFSTTPANNTVTFTTLGAVGTVTAATATQLTVTFSTQPSATGVLNANVSVFGGTTATVQVATVVSAPTITANTANLAQNAPTFVITGTNFSTTPANNSITFTTLGAVGTVTAATATQLTVTFSTQPNATGVLNATVSVFGGTSTVTQVATVVPPPTVTLNTTNLAQNAPTVIITGTNFATIVANNSVVLNLGAAGTVTAATATQLTVQFTTQPTATGSLTVVVTSNRGTSGAAVQVATIVPPPTVTVNTASLSQNAPTLVISGTNFSTTASDNTVQFSSGAVGNVTSATATQLTVAFSTQPTSLGSLTAIVTVFGGTSGVAIQVATIVPSPTITLNTALLLITKTTLVITGTNFSTTPSDNSVTFNLGAVGTVTTATSTQLTITFSTQPSTTGTLTAVLSLFGGTTGAPVQVAVVATLPVITSAANTAFKVGTNGLFSVTTTGFPAPTLIKTGALPNGVTFNDNGNGTAVLSGNATEFGLFFLSIAASNGAGPDAIQNFVLQVFPLFNFPTLAPIQVAVPVNQTLIVSGATAPYTFSVIGSLPAGLTLSASGVLSGTPTAGGPFSFGIKTIDSTPANNGGPYTFTQPYTPIVLPPAIIIAPDVLVPTNINLAYSQTLTVSGGTAPYTFSISSGALPPGLTMTSAGVISGTIGAEGTFNFVATATDSSTGTGPYKSNMPLQIFVNHAPVFASAPSASPSTVFVGQTIQFSAPVMDTDGDLLTYTWLFLDGSTSSLPNPTHSFTTIGDKSVVVLVTDSHGGQISATLVISVTGASTVPIVDTDGDGYSDEIEKALRTDPANATSRPFDLPPLIGVSPLTTTYLNIGVDFNQYNMDSITLSGTVPLPTTFQAMGKRVIVDVGGVVVPFVLQKSGKSSSASRAQNATFTLQKLSKNSTATSRNFTMVIEKGDFSDELAPYGLTLVDVTNAQRNVTVTVIINGQAFVGFVNVKYSTIQFGLSGTAVYP